MKQEQLHIGDVAVAIALAIRPGTRLVALAEACARSLGEVHNAERRLRAARLLRPSSRAVEREPLIRFIRWGVPHAFPAALGPLTRGVATARLPGQLGDVEPSVSEFVWPDPAGATRGQALLAPYRSAPLLVSRSPDLRVLLSLLDLVRVGGTREQAAATDEIAQRIAGAVA